MDIIIVEIFFYFTNKTAIAQQLQYKTRKLFSS
jgi:hypothetical protein